MIIVNLSNLCWSGGHSRRNQAIFSHLLLDTDGFEEGYFIQPPVVRAARFMQWTRTQNLEVVSKAAESGRPITVLQPVLTLPAGYPPAVTKRAISELCQKLIKEVFKDKPYFLWVNSITHFQSQIAEQLIPGAGFRVFDGSDLLMMYERNGDPQQYKQKAAILKSCDVAVCSNERLMARVDHPAKLVFPECTEYTKFEKANADFELQPLFPKRPGSVYVGLTGMIAAERIDFDLMHAVLNRFPKFHFVFTGSTNSPSLLAQLKAFKNFYHIADIGDADLPSVLHAFDVAIVPDLDNDFTRGSDTTKVLDYLACGLPVLSTASPNMDKFGDAVYIGASVWEFSNTLERLALKSRPHEPRLGMAIARKRSWSEQVPQLVDGLFDLERELTRNAHAAGRKVGAIAKAYL